MKNTSLFLISLLALPLLLTLAAPQGYANPPGVGPGKVAYKFNYIGAPVGSKDNVNCGSGHRIFTEIGATGHIQWTLGSTLGIVDCLTESIDGDWALVSVDAAGVYDVYVRILGPQGSELTFCINTLTDELGDHLCLLGSFTLPKSKDFTLIHKQLFKDYFEDIVWHLDPNTLFRIAEVRLYVPSQ